VSVSKIGGVHNLSNRQLSIHPVVIMPLSEKEMLPQQQQEKRVGFHFRMFKGKEYCENRENSIEILVVGK
jgi:hypothetical protein